MTLTATRPAASIGELRRAWQAIERGDFRTGHHAPDPPRSEVDGADGAAKPAGPVWQPPGPVWQPRGPVVCVVGALPQCGATTTALAIATAAGGASVLIECASAPASGLTSAATAELGTSPTGWALGRRDQVSIARPARTYRDAAGVPLPDQHPRPNEPAVWVLDVSWDIAHVLATPGWISTALRTAPIVVVATPTVPGVRRLETTLGQLADRHAVVAMVGPARRRWPKHVSAAAGPLTRQAAGEDRMVSIALDRHLATRGLDNHPLPGPLLTAAADLAHKTIPAPAAAETVEAADAPTTSERPPASSERQS